MGMNEHQTCPLCGEAAAFEACDFGKRKRFECPECGEFIITTGAEARVLESVGSWRDKLREAAKSAPSGKTLEIRLSPLSNRQAGAGYPVLDTEYIPQQHRPQ